MAKSAEPESTANAATGAWEDILRPGLGVVFVGYNPSLPAARTGHYYANPGNRFYHLLYASGLTPRLLTAFEDRTLPEFGIGATDLVAEPSALASDLAAARYRAGVPALLAKLEANAPRAVCCNGIGVFRHLFGCKPARLGLQPNLAIGASAVFVVPSTSGLVNGRAAERLAAFHELADWLHTQIGASEAPTAVTSISRTE
jgi:TDG/mug DNA glycosylase family protein